MKVLIIGGNRFVGLRVCHLLSKVPGIDLQVVNRTGQVAHCKNAIVHKGDRRDFTTTILDRDWDAIIDFACFNQSEAESALNYFKNVKRYIFVSTISIYNNGPDLKEADFSSQDWDLKLPPPANAGYQDGKRRAEAAFHQQARWPVLSVRFPVILGPDDYTHRLDFHVERTQRSESIYIVNPASRISMIHAQDAADFLLWSLKQTVTEPLNVCSKDPISLAGLMGQIELVTGIKPTLSPVEEHGNHSPYSTKEDWFMNTERLLAAGFTARPIADWLPQLIGRPVTGKPKFVH